MAKEYLSINTNSPDFPLIKKEGYFNCFDCYEEFVKVANQFFPDVLGIELLSERIGKNNRKDVLLKCSFSLEGYSNSPFYIFLIPLEGGGRFDYEQRLQISPTYRWNPSLKSLGIINNFSHSEDRTAKECYILGIYKSNPNDDKIVFCGFYPSTTLATFEYDEERLSTNSLQCRIESLQHAFLNGVSCDQTSNGFNISFTPQNLFWYMANRDQLHLGDLNKITSLVESHAKSFKKFFSPLDDEPLQQIFYGAPGTGKSYTIDNKTNPERTIRTTFHPDSDYASFVGAYKPTMERVPIVAFNGTQVSQAVGVNGHDGKEAKIVYKYVPQAFLKAYVAAWSNLSQPYYLVIEEINRGNCAQIFGDLFQLLDRNNMGSSSYAIAADQDITQFIANDENGFASIPDSAKDEIRSFILTKDDGQALKIGNDILNGKKLLLPPNLYIWATMNTSDQSLFPIDSAFKRRWNWEYVPIDYSKENWTLVVGNNRYYWGDFLKKINPIISDLTESPDKQMGYFFAKADTKSNPNLKSNDTISEKLFLNKVLFYLWTDVLKDFDAGKEPFINPDTKKAYEFSEFFDKSKDYLSQFIAKPELGLSPIDELSEPVEDYDTDGKVHKYGKFLANGLKSDTITWAVYILLRDFAKNANYSTIKSLIDATIVRDEDVIKMVENTKSYQKEKGWLKQVITSSDGVSFVVTNQWKSEMIPMIKQLAEKVNGTFEQVYE